MADNVTLDSGDIVATEDTGGQEYQLVKLVDGTATSTTPIPLSGDLTNGLDVDVTRVTGTVTVNGAGVTQPISAASLPLPTGAATSANQTAANADLATLAGAVSGSEIQVDVVSGNSAGTEYVEDDVASGTPTGGVKILVREDGPAAVGIDGDNVAQRGTAYGAGFVQVVDSSGNFVDTFGGAGGTSSADDADFVAGTTLGTQIQGVYESSPTSVTDGDVGQIGITATRSLKTEETNSAAILADTASIDTNSATIAGDTTSIDGKITACDTGAVVIASGTVTADLGATDNAVLDAIASSVASIDTNLGGTHVDDAAFTPATSDGVPIFGVVTSDQVDSGDAGAVRMSADRGLVIRPHTELESALSERVADTAGTSANFTTFAAGGAGVHNYVTTLSVHNSSATDGYVDIRDSSGGAVLFTISAPANSGSTVSFPVPLKGADNTALAYDVSAALTTVYISVVGFQAAG